MGKKVKKKWIFLQLLKSMISKLVDVVTLMTTWTYMNIKGQGHSESTFSNLFSSEIARPIEAKFDVEPP